MIMISVDMVNHEILLNKLERYGFNDINWFYSYLTEKKQCVKIDSQYSSFKINQCGVPQGSVLGPTLFNLYENDICYLNLKSSILMYADDVVIYCTHRDPEIIINIWQEDLRRLYKWSTMNKLSVSLKKLKYMSVGRKAGVRNCTVTSVWKD